MGSKWNSIKLGEIIEIKYGKDHKKLTDGIIPCYGSGGIMRYVNKSLYEQESILIPRKGSLNNLYYINEPFWTVDTLFWSKVDLNKADTKFVFYQLKLVDFKGLNEGTAVPSMTVPIINNINIKLPPLKVQKEISKVLTDIDNKIELNQQTNQTLEQMAQTLFKSWFVDFDPVFDNALAKADHQLDNLPADFPEALRPKAEKRLAALNSQVSTQARDIPTQEHGNEAFPSEFEFNEQLGWIPKGWLVEEVNKYCSKVQNGGTPKRSESSFWDEGTIPWLTSGEVRQRMVVDVQNKITDIGLSKSSAKWVPKYSTLVALYGATAGEVSINSFELTTNQAVCALIPNEGYEWFNYLSISRKVSEFQNKAVGSAQQNISKGLVEITKLLFPDFECIKFFNLNVHSSFEKWIANLHEIETLTKLRDTLLPKLISGELQIPTSEPRSHAPRGNAEGNHV